MIPYRRSTHRGLYWAVSLLAVIAVILSARPVAAAPQADAGPLGGAANAAPFPTRFEGQIKTIDDDRWLVDQTWVTRVSSTAVLEKRGPATVGAWILVVGDKYADRFIADTIQVLRPTGSPLPIYQFTGVLEKKGSGSWFVDGRWFLVTDATKQPAELAIGSLVRVSAQRVENNNLQALAVDEIAATPDQIPYAIEGRVEQVTDTAWVVDDEPILVPAAQSLPVNQGDTVEISALAEPDGTLVAQAARIVNVSQQALVDGYVSAVDGLGQDNQTWELVVFSAGHAAIRTIRVTPETYVDEDRALIKPDVEAQVRGLQGAGASVDAALVRLEQTVPAVAAGALAQVSSDGMWSVGGQTVWFASDDLTQEALAAAGTARTLGLTSTPGSSVASTETTIAVAGVRLSSGVLIAKEILTGEAAAEAIAASISTPKASGAAAGWLGPNDIVPAVTKANKPTILFDSNGAGHAVFEADGKIYYAYQAPGDRWSVSRKIGTGFTPSAMLDTQGRVVVAYTSEFMNNWDILSVRMTATGWSLPTVVAPTTGKSADPVVAMDAMGKLSIAWMDTTSGEWVIQFGTFDGKFWTSYPIPDGRGQSPALSMLPDGALFLAWQDRLPLGNNEWGNYDIFANEGTNGTWSTPVNVSDNGQFRPGSNSLGAHVTGTSDAFAHLAWIDDSTQLRYDFGRGQYWPAPVNIGSPRFKPEGLSMQFAPDQLLYLAWNEGLVIRVVASPPRTQTWPAAGAVATRSAPANGRVSDVSLATGRGGVAVAWVQDNASGRMGVYESRHNMAPTLLRSFLPLLIQH